MVHKVALSNKENRKETILAAALKCFLQFGYAKTSMDDVAREANLSRPLIYLKFKNKDALYIGVVEHLTEGRLEQAEKITSSNKTKRDKLIEIYEIFLLEPWGQIIGKPMSAEFYMVYKTLFREVAEKYKSQILKCIECILIDKSKSKIFMLAVEGLKSDLPEVKCLRKRLHILIDHFIR